MNVEPMAGIWKCGARILRRSAFGAGHLALGSRRVGNSVPGSDTVSYSEFFIQHLLA